MNSISQCHILVLTQQVIFTSHFSQFFKKTIMLIFCKLNKSNYIKFNAYHSIILKSTINKMLKSIMTDHISYLCETYNLLFKHHFDDRSERTAENAILILSENIHQA